METSGKGHKWELAEAVQESQGALGLAWTREGPCRYREVVGLWVYFEGRTSYLRASPGSSGGRLISL